MIPQSKLPLAADIFLITSLYTKMLLVGIILALEPSVELQQASGVRIDLLVVLLLLLSSQINRHFLKMDLVVWACEVGITACLMQMLNIWFTQTFSIIAVILLVTIYAGEKVYRKIQEHKQNDTDS